MAVVVANGSTEEFAGEQNVCMGEEAVDEGQDFLGGNFSAVCTGGSEIADQRSQPLFHSFRGCSFCGYHGLDL